VAFDASGPHTLPAAVHQTVVDAGIIECKLLPGGGIDEGTVRANRRCITGNERSGLEIIRLVVSLPIGAEQTDAHTEIQGQMGADVPIILKIWFDDLVAEVILRIEIDLLEFADSTEQQVGESISRTYVGVRRVEGQESLLRAKTILLIFFVP